MATPYSDVFDSFYRKITDYSFVNLEQSDIEDILTGYLKSAIVQFRKCKSNLSDRNDTTKTFNVTLTDDEIEILATILVYEWLHQYVNTTECVLLGFSTKDIQRTSQANHLKEVRELRKEARLTFKRMILDYTYYMNPLSGLD